MEVAAAPVLNRLEADALNMTVTLLLPISASIWVSVQRQGEEHHWVLHVAVVPLVWPAALWEAIPSVGAAQQRLRVSLLGIRGFNNMAPQESSVVISCPGRRHGRR